MNEVAVMISCAYRSRARALTAARFDRYGIRPHLIPSPCDPASAEGQRAASRAAVTLAAEQDADLLFLEDDLIPDDRLPAALTAARKARVLTVLCLVTRTCHPNGVNRALDGLQAMPTGILPLRYTAAFWGCQALWIPREVVGILIEDEHLQQQALGWPFDRVVGELYARHGWNLHSYFPNPIQHANEPSATRVTRGREGRPEALAPTFGWSA